MMILLTCGVGALFGSSVALARLSEGLPIRRAFWIVVAVAALLVALLLLKTL